MMTTSIVLACVVLVGQPSEPTVRFKQLHVERKGWYSVKASYPSFSGSSLAKFASKEWKDSLDSSLKRLDIKNSQGDEMPNHPWEVGYASTVGLRSNDVISGYSEFYFYTGGAHPNREYHGHNFGMIGGKPTRLGFGHLMSVRMAPEALASQLVLPKLKAMGASGVVDGSVSTLSREQTDNFVMTPAGITWLFSPYEVGSYAEGHFFVKVPWSEMEGKVRQKP